MKSMNELFQHFLQDIYYAEKQGLKALAKVAKSAENDEFKQFLQKHRDESQEQIGKLEEVYQQVIGKKARGKTCAAMDGLIEEVNEAIQEGDKGPVLDAALIACVQAMKHYEIARLGALAAWAKQMGQDEAAQTLHGIVEQDKEADEDLNEIAEEHANAEASDADEDEEDDEDGDDEEGEGEEEKPAEEPKPAPRRAPARSSGAGGRKKG